MDCAHGWVSNENFRVKVVYALNRYLVIFDLKGGNHLKPS